MSTESVKILSYIPGRVRLRLDEIKGQPEFAAQVEQRIAEIPGIKAVEAKSDTGSLLLKYERKALKDPATVQTMLGTLEELFPHRDIGKLRGWLEKKQA